VLDIWDVSGYNIGSINPIRYRGYYYDAETQMYYLQSRYYSPLFCRFVSADVYCDTGDGVLGTNMYCYCLNDPVNLCDPSGTEARDNPYVGTDDIK
jgi:RHS repeat-associated protein